MWDFEGENSARAALQNLLKFSSRDINQETLYKGHSKFYLKGREFISKNGDYFKTLDFDPGLGSYLATLCYGYLRFEVRLQYKQIAKEFGTYYFPAITELSLDTFLGIIQKYIDIYLRSSKKEDMDWPTAYKHLSRFYDTEMTLKLLAYGKIRDNPNEDIRAFAKDIPKSTRAKYNRLLKDADCGNGTNNSLIVEYPSIYSKNLVLR